MKIFKGWNKVFDMENKHFSIIDAITDTTFGAKNYEEFRKKYGFDTLKLKSLSEELELELEDTFIFAKEKGLTYLVKITTHQYMGMSSTSDEVTAAVIREKEPIPTIKYPHIFGEDLDLWITSNQKYF